MHGRRIIRRMIFSTATLVALAALILWPISYFSYDRLTIPLPRGHRIILGSVDGGFQFYLSIAEGLRIHRSFSWSHQSPSEYSMQRMSGFPGVRWRAFEPINISSNHGVPIITTGYMLRLSYWLILLLAL